MRQAATVNVSLDGGLRGTIDTSQWPTDGTRDSVLVRLEDGRQLMAPASALRPQPQGGYHLALGTDLAALTAALEQAGEDVTIPVIAEDLTVDKRVVETGRVRVSKVVRAEEQTFDVPVMREDVHVERVRLDKIVDAAPEVRQEGDTMIIPLLEEVVVVEKRLMLREEVRVTRRRREVQEPHTVTVREEDVKVERLPAKG